MNPVYPMYWTHTYTIMLMTADMYIVHFLRPLAHKSGVDFRPFSSQAYILICKYYKYFLEV